MKDERIIELVNGELDGTLSPSEHDELTALLDQDPSVKTFLDEWDRMHHLLAAVPMVDPPASLKASIMNAIAIRDAPVRAARESWVDRLVAPFVQRPAWAAAYAFAVGILVGLGAFMAIQPVGPDAGMVQGTIGDLKSPALAKTHVVAGTATADIVVSGLGDELRVDVTIDAPEPATLRLVPEGSDPIIIGSTSGTPAYSLLIPKASSVRIDLTSNEASEQTLLVIDTPTGD